MVTQLLVGHGKFRREYFQHERELFESLAGGRHEPTALVISCCDARVVPDVILNADPGDLFVVRNIANLVPPFDRQPGSRSVGAAIEYAIYGLKVPHIVVCGHTQCGGLKALAAGHQQLAAHMPSLVEWLHDAVELRARLEELIAARGGGAGDTAQQLVFENVAVQLENLLTYPAVQWGLGRGVLEIHGWVYDLESGTLRIYDPETNTFHPFDAAVAAPSATR